MKLYGNPGQRTCRQMRRQFEVPCQTIQSMPTSTHTSNWRENLIDHFKSSSESAATKTAGGKRPRSESVTGHSQDQSRKAKGGNYSSGGASKKKKGIPLWKQARGWRELRLRPQLRPQLYGHSAYYSYGTSDWGRKHDTTAHGSSRSGRGGRYENEYGSTGGATVDPRGAAFSPTAAAGRPADREATKFRAPTV